MARETCSLHIDSEGPFVMCIPMQRKAMQQNLVGGMGFRISRVIIARPID